MPPAIALKQPTRTGWALLLTSVAFFMVTLDSLVVVTALPAIHRELGGQVSTLEWAVSAYLRFLPWTATPLFIAPLAGALSDKLGARPLMTLGLAIQATGLAWVALLAGHTASYAEIVVPLVIAEVGVSMAIPTMPLAVMGAVAPRNIGTASGVFNMLQRFGGVVAVAVASAVFVSNRHLGTAVSFDNGFRPALLVSAGMSALGSASAILARRARISPTGADQSPLATPATRTACPIR
jgi:MFS family permease